MPTRFAAKSCSLIDQIYVKVPNVHHGTRNNKAFSAVIISNISDHLPCFISLCILRKQIITHKFITITTLHVEAISKFKEALRATNLSQQIDSRGSENPNVSYDIIEKHITNNK